MASQAITDSEETGFRRIDEGVLIVVGPPSGQAPELTQHALTHWGAKKHRTGHNVKTGTIQYTLSADARHVVRDILKRHPEWQ